MLGDAMFRDVISQYEIFLKARRDVVAGALEIVPHIVLK
jgi:hypothetical protein